MALRNLRLFGDDILHKKSRPVIEFDEKLHILLGDMWDTLAEQNGMGLAGVQVGILRRVVIVDVPIMDDDNPCETDYGKYELINPEVLEQDGEDEMKEGCLSLPGKSAPLIRPALVVVKAQDRFGEWRTFTATNLLARAVCHEVDHLNGVLYTDLIEPGTLQDNSEDFE
ncbi:MAG: peptide deformylase [Defluviitaleaceae bacterium]|nr:peptide deformylase [Defluviitaleaceae bacterium]